MLLDKSGNIHRNTNGDVKIADGRINHLLELDWLISMERRDIEIKVMRPEDKRELFREFILNFTCKMLRDHCIHKFKGNEV